MPAPHETVVFDIHDCKVYPMLTDVDGAASPTYGAAVDIPGIGEMSMEPNLITAELKGDAKLIAKKGRIDRFNSSVTYAKIDLDALAVIMGGTTDDPDAEQARWQMTGGVELPYFMLRAQIADVDVGVGDVHVVLYKCQATGGTIFGQSSDEFGQPSFDVEAIPAYSSNIMGEVLINNTETPLPATL